MTFTRYYWQLELDEQLQPTGREIVARVGPTRAALMRRSAARPCRWAGASTAIRTGPGSRRSRRRPSRATPPAPRHRAQLLRGAAPRWRAGQDWCLQCGAGARGSLGRRAGARRPPSSERSRCSRWAPPRPRYAALSHGTAQAPSWSDRRAGARPRRRPRPPPRDDADTPDRPARRQGHAPAGDSQTAEDPARPRPRRKPPMKSPPPRRHHRPGRHHADEPERPLERTTTRSRTDAESSRSRSCSTPTPPPPTTPTSYPPSDFGDPSLAIDGDTATAWTAQVDPATAPKMAEGLLIDLESAAEAGDAQARQLHPRHDRPGRTAPAPPPRPTSITDPAWMPLSPLVRRQDEAPCASRCATPAQGVPVRRRCGSARRPAARPSAPPQAPGPRQRQRSGTASPPPSWLAGRVARAAREPLRAPCRGRCVAAAALLRRGAVLRAPPAPARDTAHPGSAAISPVRRSGCRRSSTASWLPAAARWASRRRACRRRRRGARDRAGGRARASGVVNVRRSLARRRDAAEEQPLQQCAAGAWILADDVEHHVAVVRQQAPRTARVTRASSFISRLAERQRDQQRRERERAAEQPVVQHRHLDHQAAQPLRARAPRPRAPRWRRARCPSRPPRSSSRWSMSATTCSPYMAIE